MWALLQHQPAYSFKELKTVCGQIYSTYQEAAVALGLFEDVTEAVSAMEEAIASYSCSSQLWFLFTYLLLDLPTPAIYFWDTFWEALSADFSAYYNENKAICLTLEDISCYLCSQGAGLMQYGLSEPA